MHIPQTKGKGEWEGDRRKRERGRNLLLGNADWEILTTTTVSGVDEVPLKFGLKLLHLNYLKVSQVPNQC